MSIGKIFCKKYKEIAVLTIQQRRLIKQIFSFLGHTLFNDLANGLAIIIINQKYLLSTPKIIILYRLNIVQ